MKHFEYIIIGFGKGGKTLACKLAAAKKNVALIEMSEKMYGGTCINIGCIPSKSLILSANIASKHKNVDFDFYNFGIEKKEKLTSMLRLKNYEKLKNLGVEIFNGVASFVDEHTIKIDGENPCEISADKIYINTGAKPIIPNIKGVNNLKVYTSTSLMNETKLPQSLAIIGGGFIALEFAFMYASFGSKVSIFQRKDEFLANEDEDIKKAILELLDEKNIKLFSGVKFNEIKQVEHRVSLDFTQYNKNLSLDFDAILIATGRAPNTANLACENAKIKLGERGEILVNENLQTNIKHIYALGDANGGAQFTFISLDDYRVIMSNLKNQNYTTKSRKAYANSVFITPTYSFIGLNEKQAKRANLNFKVAKMQAGAIPKAHILGQSKGMLKAIINADNDLILGAQFLCEESHEMINLIKLAMDHNIKYQALRDTIYTHPSMSECFNDLFDI